MNSKKNSNKVIQFADKGKKNQEKNIDNKKNASKTRVFSVASGKGGVGKTNIVANIGYLFSRLGEKVLIFDADLSLGNIDILLGLAPKYNFSHVMTGEKTIEEIVMTGPGEIKIIPAASGIQELSDLSKSQQIWVLNELERFMNQFDLFIFDTAAGISSNVLCFCSIAQEVIIVVSPEPMSITDAYALMKILHHKHDVNKFNLIVNMAQSQKEAMDIFRQLDLVTNRFLNINLNYSGHILADEKVVKCVKKQKIVSELFPDAMSTRCYALIARQFMRSNSVNSEIKAHKNFNWKSFLYSKENDGH